MGQLQGIADVAHHVDLQADPRPWTPQKSGGTAVGRGDWRVIQAVLEIARLERQVHLELVGIDEPEEAPRGEDAIELVLVGREGGPGGAGLEHHLVPDGALGEIDDLLQRPRRGWTDWGNSLGVSVGGSPFLDDDAPVPSAGLGHDVGVGLGIGSPRKPARDTSRINWSNRSGPAAGAQDLAMDLVAPAVAE
jgi:hypothetical protein